MGYKRKTNIWKFKMKYWSDLEMFNDRYLPEPMSGCWLWIGAYNKDGYGTLTVSGKRRRAHRAAWEIFKGPIPDNLLVCHKCDNPACVNPDHLFLGSPLDNMTDMIKKGRSVRIFKIPTDTVRSIREFNGSGNLAAKIYGVSVSAACRIRNGSSRKNA